MPRAIPVINWRVLDLRKPLSSWQIGELVPKGTGSWKDRGSPPELLTSEGVPDVYRVECLLCVWYYYLFSYLILIAILQGRYYDDPHFSNE